MLTGQNGILNRAAEAKEKTEISSKDDQRKLAQAEALMNNEKTTYKGITLPEGFSPTKIEEEDSIDDGLVITDGYGNEFVWVEVPKTVEVYQTAGINIESFDNESYDKIENDLHNYTNDYRINAEYKDIYAKDTTEGWFKSESEYNSAKQKMLKSVYLNGGFWVGRYEAGTEINRTKADEPITTASVTKADMYPYTYITRTQAKILAENSLSGNYTRSLMFGVQWDLMLKYIETKNSKNIIDIKTKLNVDSSEIGNYCNSEFVLNRGKYAIFNNNILNDKWNNYDSSIKEYVDNKCKKRKDKKNRNINNYRSDRKN